MSKLPYTRKHTAKYIVFITFGILYAVISLVNHYLFRTNAHDFGIFNQAIWDYAHFRFNHNTVIQPNFGNILGDHFELLLILISPFYYVFGTYTLLIFQIIAFLLGGQGIYKYVYNISKNDKFALAASIHFFLFFGIYSALAFDYHNNVVGAMAVPWIFYFFQKEQWKSAFIAFVVFLIAKENMALWGFFIFLGLMIHYRKDKKKLTMAFIFSLISVAYFFIVIKALMPLFFKEGCSYVHFKYSAIGNNITEAIATIITRPLYVGKLLFVNHLGIETANYVKIELHILVMLSGGMLLFLRPQYLLMLLPIYVQKMLFDSPTLWGLGFHYSVEFIPIISVGAFTFINELKKEKHRRIIVYSLIVVTAIVTFHTFDHTYTYFNRQKQRFYQRPHYKRNFNVHEAYKALNTIPAKASVCAQDEFVSHLSFRKKIYLYPNIEDAEYVVLSTETSIYPFLNETDYTESVLHLLQSNNWDIVYNKNTMYILKRKD